MPASFYTIGMSKEKTIKISVRNLVEFVFREGDIVSGGTGVRNVEAMQLGSRIHRKIQKSMGVGYESEVLYLRYKNLRVPNMKKIFP